MDLFINNFFLCLRNAKLVIRCLIREVCYETIARQCGLLHSHLCGASGRLTLIGHNILALFLTHGRAEIEMKHNIVMLLC